ncbi:MAG TPA: glycoside hydrolase family 3 C-terminal domain-containing protein [Bacteroidota bacterium]|nr:glycoside hydrolase family 3 C-terminal domain-containing protein [Bacteroidota bacterium]
MSSFRWFILLLFLCTLTVSMAFSQSVPVYKDSKAPVESRVQDLLSKMTLEEKIDMLGGVEGFYIRPCGRLGIPKVKMADGPLGVRNYGKSTAFPAGIAFAASWNKALVEEYGKAIGTEARAKGVHIMLAPGVNIYRAPMCGRNFEYYGEDPYLASRMVVGYVTGVQSKGVVATAKHYAANNEEYDRHTVSSDVDERTLREIYLPTFRAAVEEAHVGSVMNSYNLINGIHAAQHQHLLNEVLKGDWKFDGFVMSDWGSTYDGVASANGGLDLEMPSGVHMNRDTLMPAIKSGKLGTATIDDKVRRMLRVMFRFGFFDKPQQDTTLPLYNPDSKVVALQAAREGSVLLKNMNNVLPLDRAVVKSIAVVGPNAYPAVTGGGGSSTIQPFRSVSVLDGIITAAGQHTKVYFAPGTEVDIQSIFKFSEFMTTSPDNKQVRGLKGEYFTNRSLSGQPALTRIDRHVAFQWGEGSPASVIPEDDFSARWTGRITPETDGEYEFFVQGDDGFRLTVGDKLLIDEWHDQAAMMKRASLPLKGGSAVDIKLEYYEHSGNAEISFGWSKTENVANSEAVKVAALSDAAIVCVGFNSSSEGEGFDRPFDLPNEQVELIRAVAGVNKRTIVVLTAGGNVGMTGWLNDVAGLLHVWYPGQEGGTAVAEILFGDVNPSGHLPATFEKRWEDNATFNSYYAKDKHLEYTEGVFVGYRHFDSKNIEPLFPFGFGLSYTTFEYKNLHVTPSASASDPKIQVEFEITNTGERTGSEVAQVYVGEMNPSLPRPPKELKGFEKVSLKAGESTKVSVSLDKNAFAYYDVAGKRWAINPGRFLVSVGSSSRLIRFSQAVTLK